MKKYLGVVMFVVIILFVTACKKEANNINADVHVPEQTKATQNDITQAPTEAKTQPSTETVTEPQTYVLKEGVIDSNPDVWGQRYTYIDHFDQEFSMVLQQNADKTTFDTTRLKVNGKKYEYYSEDGSKLISKWGVDVSGYQGYINWNKLKEQGVEFAIIRLGYRGYGQYGNIVYDTRFKENIKGAIDAGIEVGVYFFSQALNDKEALEEAEFVINALREYEITYPVVFDTEAIDASLNPRTKDITRDRVTKNCIIFCDAINEAGYKSMIYYNMPWCAKMLDLEKLNPYDIWYADYTGVPQSPYKFSMWQYTEKGRIDGVNGDIDFDIYIIEE